MKKSIFSLLAVALMASAANAATIGLQWAANPGDSNSDGGGTVNIHMTSESGTVIGGFVFEFNENQNILVSNVAASLPNWDQSPVNAPMVPGTQIAVSALAGSDLQGDFDGVIATFDLSVIGALDGLTKAITFDAASNVAGVVDNTGSKLLWDARYAVGYSGYIAYADYGNPGWGTKTAMGHQPTANPLFLTKVPEPSSLALIALGGFALLRRSR